jgi:hypothetical protein
VREGAAFGNLLAQGGEVTRMVRRAAICLLVTRAAGCADEIDPRPASFPYIWAAIIQPGCTTSGCHSKLSATYGLQYESMEGTYYALTGRACGQELTGEAPRNYVVPGHPDRSKLMYLLTGEQLRRMPPDAPLPEPDIALIERWILAGALCE